MWQTKYASAEPKNLGLALNFQPLLHTYKVQIKSLLQKDVLSHNSLSPVIPEQTTNTYYVR